MFTPLPPYLQGLLKNNSTYCDALEGPCECGAWHNEEDLESRLKNNLVSFIDIWKKKRVKEEEK